MRWLLSVLCSSIDNFRLGCHHTDAHLWPPIDPPAARRALVVLQTCIGVYRKGGFRSGWIQGRWRGRGDHEAAVLGDAPGDAHYSAGDAERSRARQRHPAGVFNTSGEMHLWRCSIFYRHGGAATTSCYVPARLTCTKELAVVSPQNDAIFGLPSTPSPHLSQSAFSIDPETSPGCVGWPSEGSAIPRASHFHTACEYLPDVHMM